MHSTGMVRRINTFLSDSEPIASGELFLHYTGYSKCAKFQQDNPKNNHDIFNVHHSNYMIYHV